MNKREFKNARGEVLRYRLFVPRGYDPAKKYPIILFLHGMGERGNDNESQLKHGEVLCLVSEEVAQRHPCFLVAPQCPDDDFWAALDVDRSKPYTLSAEPTKPLRLTMELVDSLEEEFSIDPARRYVTGLSMGGFGSLDLCAAAQALCRRGAHLRTWRHLEGQGHGIHCLLGVPWRGRRRRSTLVFAPDG